MTPRTAHRLLLPAAAIVLVMAGAGCSTDVAQQGRASASRETDLASRPAKRGTCPEAVVDTPPAGMSIADRELVPFSSTRFGVESELATRGADDDSGSGTERSVEIISGGFVDDVTESYDDLHVTGSRLIHGRDMTLMAGGLLTQQIKLSLWHESTAEPPCDVHVIVGTNLSASEFDRTLASVRVVAADPAQLSDDGSAAAARGH